MGVGHIKSHPARPGQEAGSESLCLRLILSMETANRQQDTQNNNFRGGSGA
jgi:hypothetical protein